MASVVHNKKKRDKKKKIEDEAEEVSTQQPAATVTATPFKVDELNIHIHKEATTGGGLCAKLIFFVVLTLLTTLIGLIITSHRGVTDLDTINTESAFAHIFDGWIDNSPDVHEETFSTEHSHEEDDEEGQSHSSHDDDDDDEDHNEKEVSEEDEEEDSQNPSDEQTQEDEEYDNKTVEEEKEEEEYEEEQESQEYSNEEKYAETEEKSVEKDVVYDEESQSSVVSKEKEEVEEDEYFKKDMVNRLRGKIPPKNKRNKYTITKTTVNEVESKEYDSADAQEDDEVEEETEKQTTDDTAPRHVFEKTHVEKDIETDDNNENTIDINSELEQESSNMVVRFGVGTALLVVAHVVLIKKWRTARVTINKPQLNVEDDESLGPDLSRRNTIVAPPTLETIGHDFDHAEEDYSEEEDYDSEEEKIIKTEYQKLQSAYSNNLTPDWEPRQHRSNREDEEEEEEDYMDDDDEQGYDEDEEEDRGEEYGDEISENEDEELLRRLQAKYGILRENVAAPDVDDEENEEEDVQEEDEEEEDEEEEDVEQNDDDDAEAFAEDGSFDHWKRAKFMPIKDSDSEDEQHWSKERSGAQNVYDFNNITNSDDWKIREELDRNGQNLANDAAYALTLFNKLLEKYPYSPRALYGKAQALDILAEQKKNNKLLEASIAAYQEVLKVEKVPDALFRQVAERCIDRIRFRGNYNQAVSVHKLLVAKYPEIVNYQNQLAVTYLTMNNFYEAKKVLYNILLKWPNNGFAMVNYGFILKRSDLDLKEAVKYLKKGIATRDAGVIDGRFYYHLGDALIRLGRKEEAMAVHIDGVNNKVFLSKYQRSLHNVKRLTGKPWWKKEDMPNVNFFEKLEQNWKVIRDEGLSLLNTEGLFKSETEDLREAGDWKQFELYARGMKNTKNCKQCPKTCHLIETFPDAIGCRRGQIKFSVVQPGTHVWPHCGPTNCRLRSHLGLKVPANVYIRVAEEIRSWEEGKLLIFDDSFEHELWHNGTSSRLILIVDFWHPELRKEEKRSLSNV